MKKKEFKAIYIVIQMLKTEDIFTTSDGFCGIDDLLKPSDDLWYKQYETLMDYCGALPCFVDDILHTAKQGWE